MKHTRVTLLVFCAAVTIGSVAFPATLDEIVPEFETAREVITGHAGPDIRPDDFISTFTRPNRAPTRIMSAREVVEGSIRLHDTMPPVVPVTFKMPPITFTETAKPAGSTVSQDTKMPPLSFEETSEFKSKPVAAAKVSIKEGVASKLTAPPQPSCEHYFGAVEGLTTVVDTRIFGPKASKFCGAVGLPMDQPCGFVHKAGDKCVSPAPPDKGYCHHYKKVTYSFCPLLTDTAIQWVGKVDADRRFDLKTGYIKGCEADIVSEQTFCYEAPEDAPVQCSCDA